MKSKTNTHDKLIGRLPEADRRAILEAAARRPQLVAVEHSYWRKFDEAVTTVGTILTVAYSTSGGCSDVLVIRPANPELRPVAISAAHVLRIRNAHPTDVAGLTHRLGEVIAGPPLKDGADR